MTDLITLDTDTVLRTLDERGWLKGRYGDNGNGPVCLHGAIRLCTPQPGDAQIIEQVANQQGWGIGWNDAATTTEADVRARIEAGLDVSDDALAEVFGPQWRAVVELVRRAAVLTVPDAAALNAAWNAARVAAGDAARNAARVAAGDAAWNAARVAAGIAAGAAAWIAAGIAAGAAAGAAVTWDLATLDGPYTIAHRDLLIGPWRDVIGLPSSLVEATP